MKNILKNLGLLVCTLILSWLLGNLFSRGFIYIVGGSSESLLSFYTQTAYYLVGIVLAYIFFLTLLFTAFGGVKKYWWVGVLLIPAMAFELYFDLAHIYFPVVLALLGWAIGLGISKLMKNKLKY